MKSLILVFMMSLSFVSFSQVGEMPDCDSEAAKTSKCDCLKTTDGATRVHTYDDNTQEFVPRPEAGSGEQR